MCLGMKAQTSPPSSVFSLRLLFDLDVLTFEKTICFYLCKCCVCVGGGRPGQRASPLCSTGSSLQR